MLNGVIVIVVIAEQSADDRDDDIYDELLGLRVDDDWLTQPTSDQPGCLLSSYAHICTPTHRQRHTHRHTHRGDDFTIDVSEQYHPHYVVA